MQLNVHVPREMEGIIADLDAVAEASGRSKNQIVLEALAAHLAPRARGREPRLRTWNLGTLDPIRRSELYEDRLNPGPGAPGA